MNSKKIFVAIILISILLPEKSFADGLSQPPNDEMALELKSITEYDPYNISGTRNAVDFREPDRVYQVDLSKIESLDLAGPKATRLIIKEDFDWEYPLVDEKGGITCSYTLTRLGDGRWFGTGQRNVSTESIRFAFDQDISEYLAAKGIDVQTAQRFRIYALGLDFFYIVSHQGEFLLPLHFDSGADDRIFNLKLEDKKVYKASVVLRAIVEAVAKNPNIDIDGYPKVSNSQAASHMQGSPLFLTAPAEVNKLMSNEFPNLIRHLRDGPGAIDISGFSPQPYRVYGVNLAKAKSLPDDYRGHIKEVVNSIIAGDHSWEYPLLDSEGKFVLAAAVRKVRGAWGLPFAFENVSPESMRLGSNPGELFNLLKNRGLRNVKSVKRFRIAGMGMDFIFVDDDRKQYLIPLDLVPRPGESLGDRLDLEDRKLYPADFVMKKIIERANSDEDIGATGDSMFGGERVTQTNVLTEKKIATKRSRFSLATLLAGALALVGIAAIVVVLRAKRISH